MPTPTHRRTIVLALLILSTALLSSAQPVQSTITDTVPTPNSSTLFSGALQISNPVLITVSGGFTVANWIQTVPLSIGIASVGIGNVSTPVTYVSGGSASGTGNCLATAVPVPGATGSGASGVISVSSDMISGPITLTPTFVPIGAGYVYSFSGVGYNAIPTNWTLSVPPSGGATTCSGTITTSGGSLSNLFSVTLVPNDSVLPADTFYVFKFTGQPTSGPRIGWSEYCTLTTVGSPFLLSNVCVPSAPIPTGLGTLNISSIQTVGDVTAGGNLNADGNIYADVNGSSQGCLQLQDAGAVHTLDLCAPSSGYTGTLYWPTAAGTTNQALTVDASGNMSWQSDLYLSASYPQTLYNSTGSNYTTLIMQESSSQAGATCAPPSSVSCQAELIFQTNAGLPSIYLGASSGVAFGNGTVWDLFYNSPNMALSSGFAFKWNSAATVLGGGAGSADVGIDRESAGILQITNGSAGYGTVDAGSFYLHGAPLGFASLAGTLTAAQIPNNLFPAADSTSAFLWTNAAQSSAILGMDSTNIRVAIGKNHAATTLEVNGISTLDNYVANNTPSGTISGSPTAGSVNCSTPVNGTAEKRTICVLAGYTNTSGPAQIYTFPTAFTIYPGTMLTSSGSPTSCGTYNPTFSATAITFPTNAAMTAETCTVIAEGR